MDEQETSGMAIGMIIGGVVGVVVIVVGIVGVGFFWLMVDNPGPPGGGGPALVAVKAEVAAAEDAKAPAVEEGPAPKRAIEQEKKFLGAWTATFKDGRTETWDVHDDATMEVSVKRPGQPGVRTTGHWQLTAPLDGEGVTIWHVSDAGQRTRWNIRYLDDDRFVVVPNPAAQDEGVPAKGPDQDVPYLRQREEKQP